MILRKQRPFILSITVVLLLILTMLPTTVLAHSGGPRYSLCTADDCAQPGVHAHSGVYYSGHYLGDGHEHHQVCAVQNCVNGGVHEHDGTAYFAHHSGDGHSYHSSAGHSGRHGGRGHH